MLQGFQFAFVILGIATGSLAGDSGAVMSDEKIAIHQYAEDLLFNDYFLQVDSLYADFIHQYPNDPAGYLFRAGGLLALMSDREEKLYEDRFHSLLDSAGKLINETVERTSGRDKAWHYLMRGHIKAYRALYESKFGSFLSALKLGMKSKGDYNAALEADSSLYDSYFGLGSYHYWKSAKTGFLRFVGFFKNEKEQGINELQLAIDSSLLSRHSALSALIRIQMDRKKFDSAIILATAMSERFPDGKSFLWPLAESYYRSKKNVQSLEIYRKLRTRVASNPGNYYNLIEIDYYICKLLNKLDSKDEAAEAAQAIKSYRRFISRRIRERQERKLAFLDRIAVASD